MGHNINKIFLSCTIIALFTFSLVSPILLENNLNNVSIDSFSNIIDDDNIPPNTSDLTNRIKYDYTPIDSFSDSGDSFVIDDTLAVYDSLNIDLNSTNDYNNSYTITSPTSYSDDILQYNLTLESAIEVDFIQDGGNRIIDELTSSIISYAIEFDVLTPYAIFHGAQLGLETFGLGYVGDEIDIYLVEKSVSGTPNMSAILSTAIDNTFSLANPLPVSSVDIMAYIDFVDYTLSIGSYFVVANLSTIDVDDDSGLFWRSQQISQGRTYYHDGTSWVGPDPNGRTVAFASHIQESDSGGNPLTYTDPTTVNLTDNGADVTTLDQIISGTGLHILTSNKAVILQSNSSYQFSRTYASTSVIDLLNSTYNEYSNTWTHSWTTDIVSLGTYTNPTRFQAFSVPNDWNKTDLSFLLNGGTPISGSWVGDVFEFDLSILFNINQYDGGNFEFTITSPNYIITTSISDMTQELGYWTHNETHASGFEGTTILSTASIENFITSGGALNYSVLDSNGNILPLKSSLPVNLIYLDNSSYTKNAYTEGSLFKANVTFDPSISASDTEGYWTVVYYWTNGTEAGLFTQTITVVKPTLASFFVEEEVGGNWLELSSTEITRINGEAINIKVSYYNISDPFFTGLGTYIPNGDVYYTTSWLDTDNLAFDSGNYSYSIAPNITEGSYLIDIFAQGPFLQSHSDQFSLILLHEFRVLEPQSVNQVYYYTDNAEFTFSVVDVTNGSAPITNNLSIHVAINGTSLTPMVEYMGVGVDDHFLLTIYNDVLDNLPANYEVEISVQKTYFVETLGDPIASNTINYDITTVEDTSIEPIASVTEANTSSQVTLTFEWIDETHSEQIKGATVVVSLDIPEPDVELIENSENDGIYTIIVRINEPTILTLNVRVTASKEGYDSVLSFILATISIKTPSLPTTPPPTTPTNGGLPIGLIIGLSLVAVAGLGIGAFFFTRTQMSKRKEKHETHKSKARAIFQSAFMIKRILVVHHETSSPIYEYSLDDRAELDPSIISGVLQAISSIGAEMSGARTGIKKIEYYNFVVTSASSGAYTSYIFSDTELEVEFEQGLDNLVRWFDVIFGYEGSKWEGSMDIFNEYKESINEKVVEELFLWFMFPLQVAPQIIENLNKLKTIDQEIVSFIKGKGKATTAVILDQLDEYSNEEILDRIMTLVKEEKLKTNNSDGVTSK